MSSYGIPGVFVSSTCYDLKQVRTDLKTFIESFGFDAILSEFSSFPVDPDLGTVDNCRQVVQERADLFVLVVGGRYGSLTDEGKSITNLEYLTARAKTIPVYVFVSRTIHETLPIWADNPQGDFKRVVDTSKVFEFISSIKDSGEVWVYPFDTAQDIVDILRKQWPVLLRDALQLRLKAKANRVPDYLSRLSGAAYRLVLERPRAWEYRLFSCVLSDGLAEVKDLRRDYDLGIEFGAHQRLRGPIETLEWTKTQVTALRKVSAGLDKLINTLKAAFGPLGHSGDPEAIVYVAKKITEGYSFAIKWSLDARRVVVDDQLERLMGLMANLTVDMIRQIEEFCADLEITLADALKSPPGSQKPTLTLRVTVSYKQVTEELARVRRIYAR